MPRSDPDAGRTRKRCVAAALTIALAAASPQARAADFARSPGIVTVDRHRVPTDESAPAASRHETQTPDDDTSRTVKNAAVGTVITIIVAAGVCLASGGALCMFPVGF
jgi:hypothetical protein